MMLCSVLWLGASMGLTMPPERLEQLLRQMSSPHVAHTLRTENEDDLEN